MMSSVTQVFQCCRNRIRINQVERVLSSYILQDLARSSRVIDGLHEFPLVAGLPRVNLGVSSTDVGDAPWHCRNCPRTSRTVAGSVNVRGGLKQAAHSSIARARASCLPAAL